MSDNSSSTGSSRSGSSTNSWTMLSPEEAAESIGPVEDGTESLGDVPSLSEEVTGTTEDCKTYQPETPVETVLSEEGQQVCQETAPAPCEGPVPSSPTLLSPFGTSHVPPDNESQPEPPVIHDMVTSSPADNEQISAMPFLTHADMVVPLEAPFAEPPPSEDEPEFSPAHERFSFERHARESSAETDRSIHMESPTQTGLPSDIGPLLESSKEPLSLTPETPADPQSPTPDRPSPETIDPAEQAEEPGLEKEDTELPEKVTDLPEEEDSALSFDLGKADTSTEEGDGLRRRNVAPMTNTSDDEEDEEVEFKLAERKEEKRGFSINVCIVGALILLCLGSLFLSDDSDELSTTEPTQDWLNDPLEMKEILNTLTHENQQISQIETQLQAHEEELDLALNAESATGNEDRGDLERENGKLKAELSGLPALKEELEMLKARVTELLQLTTANQETPQPPLSPTAPSNGQPEDSNQSSTTAGPERKDKREEAGLKEELQRQKGLLEESRVRLEGMTKDGGHKKDGGYQKKMRKSLAEIQERLSQQVEKMGQRNPWQTRNKSDRKNDKENDKDHWKKVEKERKGEKDWKHGKDKREGVRKDERNEKDWKTNKENSHKEAWRKNQEDWERKKADRRMDRDKRKQERPWQSRKEHTKESSHQHLPDTNHQHHHQTQQYDHTTFWKQQEEKLRRNLRPLAGCSSVEDCANQEGLFPVELAEFEELLDGYVSKLERATPESKAELQKLATQFFQDGVFVHNKVLFSEFAEDVADILEDMADVLEVDGQEDEALEEAMEEFEREALWKFAATA
ncbi:hypothetical protein UPYG_G00341570 [Umbra pygmaea]|uniref:Pre-B-cell leukemia homeobox interacting protein 1a n=1 Tax=Umbra pygmaea TaxID=75934 RepID=A0ABD0VX92_UMBPY